MTRAERFIGSLRDLAARARALRGPNTTEIQLECYERLRARLVGDPILRMDECGGTFAMDIRSDVFKRLFVFGDYEGHLMRLCKRLADPQRDAIDVGANIGFFAVLLAKHLAPAKRCVLAIEPTPNALRRLRDNLDRNGVSEAVTVFDGVASQTSGTAEVMVVVGKEEYSSMSGVKHPKMSGVEGDDYSIETLTVKAATVDELVAAHGLRPGFMKVDVEGSELKVFRGALQTLEKHRPVVVSELSERMLAQTGSSAAALVDLFTQLDYVLRDPHEPSRPVNLATEEVLCVPRERLSVLDSL